MYRYSEDLVVCSALGVDMYDCVFPTRTARFGNALTRHGALKLRHSDYSSDFTPIDRDCSCSTCKTFTRAYISRLIRQKSTVGCHLVSVHNIAYQLRLMSDIRNAIMKDVFGEWVKAFMKGYFLESVKTAAAEAGDEGGREFEGVELDKGKAIGPDGYPVWVSNALASVGIHL